MEAGPSVFSTNVQEKLYNQVMKRLYHGDCVSNRVQRKVKKIVKVGRGGREQFEGDMAFMFFFGAIF